MLRTKINTFWHGRGLRHRVHVLKVCYSENIVGISSLTTHDHKRQKRVDE